MTDERHTPQPTGEHTVAPAHASGPGHREAGRHRTRADERIAELDVSPTKLLADIEALQVSLEEARARAEEHLALAQRAAADYANLKRRTAEERERDLGLASEALLAKVVALADDFDRALEHVPEEARQDPWLEGIVAIDRKLRALLESEGVTPIEALGRPFDPREHEALQRVEGTGEAEGLIVAEIRRGYRLRDRVLRAALVAVSDGSPAPRPN
jgi:molecular chaperone GrpE